jgi:hypothetical protein
MRRASGSALAPTALTRRPTAAKESQNGDSGNVLSVDSPRRGGVPAALAVERRERWDKCDWRCVTIVREATTWGGETPHPP